MRGSVTPTSCWGWWLTEMEHRKWNIAEHTVTWRLFKFLGFCQNLGASRNWMQGIPFLPCRCLGRICQPPSNAIRCFAWNRAHGIYETAQQRGWSNQWNVVPFEAVGCWWDCHCRHCELLHWWFGMVMSRICLPSATHIYLGMYWVEMVCVHRHMTLGTCFAMLFARMCYFFAQLPVGSPLLCLVLCVEKLINCRLTSSRNGLALGERIWMPR